MCYGVCDAVGCISFGSAVRAFGRVPIFVFAALLNVALIITMLQWRPNPSEPVIFFVIAGLWGLADSIWQTLVNSNRTFNLIIECIIIFLKHILNSTVWSDFPWFRGGCI